MNHMTLNTAMTTTYGQLQELQNLPDEISVVHWLHPWERLPEEASYVLIKQDLGEDGIFCLEGAYEKGRFWDMVPESAPLNEQSILGWSYLPFDDRLMAM